MGVLWVITVVHVMLSMVLGALIAGVWYYGKQKQQRKESRAISEDMIAKEKSKGDNYH